MKHISLLVAAVITVSGVHAGLNPSQSLNPARSLARTASIQARQNDEVDTSTAEHCGTDTEGYDWWCEDPSTTCCFGSEVWQCAPIVAEECCTTGYYCEAGTHCYLEDDTGDQYCLTPEEVAEQEQAVGDDDDSTSSGSSGGGGIRFKPTKPASAAAAAQTVSSKSGSGGKGKKGGSSSGESDNGSKSAAGRVGGAGGALAGVVAFGALALAMA